MNTECLDDLHMVHVGSEFLHSLSHALLHVWLHSIAVAAIQALVMVVILFCIPAFDLLTYVCTSAICERQNYSTSHILSMFETFVTFRNLVGNLFFFAHILWNFL